MAPGWVLTPPGSEDQSVVVKAPLPQRQVTEPSETVLMKIETDNPDVVIYWIAETKGETK